ncbi:hypothetical protein [Bradyrhizobium sp. AS23.2]|uniref:hypothetical protein n=1 Tax=Bradyrhizobium sp. AS23.2 TaxID=1680155 RepID=UPI001432240D|nr:hypothetical protein [Bradyrhizobium sp. AS23.2]
MSAGAKRRSMEALILVTLMRKAEARLNIDGYVLMLCIRCDGLEKVGCVALEQMAAD